MQLSRQEVAGPANRHAPTCAWLPIYFAPDCSLTALHCLTSNLFQSRTSSLTSAPKAQIYNLDWYLNCIDSDTIESSWQEDISYICAQLFQFFSVCTGWSSSLLLSYGRVFHFYIMHFVFLYFCILHDFILFLHSYQAACSGWGSSLLLASLPTHADLITYILKFLCNLFWAFSICF